MEQSSPKDEREGPWATLMAMLAERGAWRLRSHKGGREATLDTLLGRMEARDPALLGAIADVRTAPLYACVRRIDDDVCVETLPPVIAQGARALSSAGTLSTHAFELVSAALERGRNVLCAGPYAAAWPAMAAWLEAGRQPAVLPGTAAASRRWRQVGSADDAVAWGADRIGAWGRGPKHVARACKRLSGVLGHIEAPTLERALMRFEQAIGGQSAMGLLASVDLVVCVSLDADGKARVDGIYEMVMTESAYRPSPLFLRHTPPRERASGPLLVSALPTFAETLWPVVREGLLDELAAAAGTSLPMSPVAEAAGQQAAEALRHGELERRVAAHVGNAPPDGHGPFSAQAAMMLAAPRVGGQTRGRGVERAPAHRARKAAPATPASSLPLSPGWELEQMADLDGPLPFPEDEPGTEEHGETSDVDAAALAATFGLAPPKAPRALGVEAAAGLAPRPTVDGQAPSFLDALAKTSRPSTGVQDTFVGSAPHRPTAHADEPTVAMQPQVDFDETDSTPARGDDHNER